MRKFFVIFGVLAMLGTINSRAEEVAQLLATMPQNVNITFVRHDVDTFQLTKIGDEWMVKKWSKPTVNKRVNYTYFQVNKKGEVTSYAEKRDDRAWSVSATLNPETGKYFLMEDVIGYSSFNELFSAWFDMDEESGAHLDSDFQPNGETIEICGFDCVVYTKEEDSHIFAVAEPIKLVFKIDLPDADLLAHPLIVLDYNTNISGFPIDKP